MGDCARRVPAMALSIPEEFRRCCEDHSNYPVNLKKCTLYDSGLDSRKTQLQNATPKLLRQTEYRIDVPFRDWVLDGQRESAYNSSQNLLTYIEPRFKKKAIRSDAQLQDWLGIRTEQSAGSSKIVATKPDPPCRFMCAQPLIKLIFQ